MNIFKCSNSQINFVELSPIITPISLKKFISIKKWPKRSRVKRNKPNFESKQRKARVFVDRLRQFFRSRFCFSFRFLLDARAHDELLNLEAIGS